MGALLGAHRGLPSSPPSPAGGAPWECVLGALPELRAPCVAVLSDLRVRGDVERGKKEAWRPAGGRILEAEPGFSALSVRAHWSQLR